MKNLAVVCVALLACSPLARAASAPWYRAAALLQKTIGASPCFQVGRPQLPTDGGRVHTIAIQACAETAAQGLALVIKKDFGYVAINVLKPSGEKVSADATSQPAVEQLKAAFDAGLTQNPYYVAFHPRGGFADVTVEFKREVIQLFTDNLADLYGMSNYVAAEAFSQVLDLKYDKLKVGTTTSVR